MNSVTWQLRLLITRVKSASWGLSHDKRNFRSVIPPEPPLKSGGDDEPAGFDSEAENCEDSFESSTLDGCTLWTNDKHDLYITNLEISFVKQLHQSMDFLVRCSERNNADKSISQNQQGTILSASDQFTVSRHCCHQEINNKSDDLFCHVSADLLKPLTYELAACSEQFSSNVLYEKDLFDLIKEGMGQNFENEDNLLKCNSGAKRLKKADADGSSHDQIMLFRE